MLNWTLIGKVILPAWINGSLGSVLIAVVVGGLVGLIIGAFKRRIEATVIPAIAGCHAGVYDAHLRHTKIDWGRRLRRASYLGNGHLQY